MGFLVKSASAPAKEPKVYLNLEVLRFLAALAVVLVHYPWFANFGLERPTQAQLPALAGPLSAVYGLGGFGVQFFWMLSGFIFFSQYAQKIADRQISGRRFAVWRFSRLYPLHIVTAVIALGIHNLYRVTVGGGDRWFQNTPETLSAFLPHLFMASAFTGATPGHTTMNFPIWSVSLELAAYISFFLMMRYLPRVAVALTAGALIGYFFLDAVPFNGIAQTLILFYLGGGIFYVVKLCRARMTPSMAQITALTAVTGATLIYGTYWYKAAQKSLDIGFYSREFAVLPIVAALVLTIFATALGPQLGKRLGIVATHLGSMTYSSYLIHFPLMLIVMMVGWSVKTEIPFKEPWFLAVWLMCVFGLSWCVYRWFERPVQDWLRALLSGDQRPR